MKLNYPYCYIFLIFFIARSSVAQEVKQNISKIDSIQQLIENHPNEDEEMVVLLNEYAHHCLHNLEFQKGLIAIRNARVLAEKLNFEGGEIMYYLSLSTFQVYGPMRSYYQKQAQWLSMQRDKQLGKYNFDPDIIRRNAMGDNWIGLIDQFTSTLLYFENVNDKEIQANVLAWIAYFHFRRGDNKEAMAINERIIVLYKELGQLYPVFFGLTEKMSFLIDLGKTEEAKQVESELVELITQSESEPGIGLITSTMGFSYANNGRHALAIEYYMKSAAAFEHIGDLQMLAQTYVSIGSSYENLEMNSKAAESYANAIAGIENLKDSSRLFVYYNYIVSPLIAIKKYDEAMKYMVLALHDTITENRNYILARYHDAQGQILRDQGNYAEAIPYFKNAFQSFNAVGGDPWAAPFMPLYLSECYLKTGDIEVALKYALQTLELESAIYSNNNVVKRKVNLILSQIYEQQGNQSMAFKYLKMHQDLRAEIDKLDEANRIADAEVRSVLDKSQKEINQLEKEKFQKVQESKNQRLWIFSVSGAFISAVILSVVLYRNNQNKQKANALLKEQKEEIQVTLEKLEATQSQLVQSEKMASLGELTAGIAHEIQNPLNFVNNFSEVNTELIDELKKELAAGNRQLAEELADDIKGNEEKINHHGKRADAIVKGMLQHSRSSSGVKELTNINELCDEYLRLSYHGLRAKDKTFSAKFETDFDYSLPKVNVVPQEIGRVVLNLINNAFYTVTEKSKQTQNNYEPTVSITTIKSGDKVLISVKDNGNGIPELIREKIFQPFFTTKPTGQGTGLGLSLSYDIVKAHSGELKVDTTENGGSTFILHLPVN